jgi:hypothetical protein
MELLPPYWELALVTHPAGITGKEGDWRQNGMKKLAFVGFLTISTLLAQPPGPPPGGRMGFGGRGPGFGPGGFERTVAGAPYTATEVSTSMQALANGNTIQRSTQTNISRDGQGRVRMETTVKHQDGTTSTHITIHDPVAGVVHNIDTQNKLSHDMALHAPPNGQGRGRGPGRAATSANGASPDVASGRGPRRTDPNLLTEHLGMQTLSGVSATGTRMTRTIPAGEEGNSQPIVSVHESWMADDLKVPVMVKSSDPRFGTTQTQLTNVVRAEPDATLFQVPAGYTVVKDHGGPRGRGPNGPGPGQPK